jgi:hypothetical protein
MRLNFGNLAAAALAVVIGTSAVPAHAVQFTVTGMNSATSTATVDFTYDGVNQITIGIRNTESFSVDPRITAFAFNAPSAVTGATLFSVSGTANNSNWGINFSPDSINTPGSLGKFDVGGLTGPNFNGGDPNSGITKNSLATFILNLTGNAGQLAALTAASFLDLLSTGEQEAHAFAVRFQRLDTPEGSDVAVGGPTPIPLPASALLLMLGMGGFGFFGWRRRSCIA